MRKEITELNSQIKKVSERLESRKFPRTFENWKLAPKIIKDENKNKKIVPLSKKKTSQNLSLQQKSQQRNKYLECPLNKILEIMLKMDKRGTQRNGPKNKENDKYAQVFTLEMIWVDYIYQE